jgi:hypothetical protein
VYYPAPSGEPTALAETWRLASFAAGQMAILTARPVPRAGASAGHLKDAAYAAVLVVYEAYDGEGAIFFERQHDHLRDAPTESWEDWYLRTGEDQLRELAREAWDPVGVGGLTRAHELDEYLPGLADAVRHARNAEQLARYLTEVEHRYFVADRTEDELLPAARKILTWYHDSAAALG